MGNAIPLLTIPDILNLRPPMKRCAARRPHSAISADEHVGGLEEEQQ
jgi:hypothetical protein